MMRSQDEINLIREGNRLRSELDEIKGSRDIWKVVSISLTILLVISLCLAKL